MIQVRNNVVHCYNCGMELSESELTREHIPARALFEGYSDECKTNRITVPACYGCNQAYSRYDEEFRNLIGIMADKEVEDAIAGKAVRSILRKENGIDRLLFDINYKVAGVRFDQNIIKEFHKKNFKGIYFYQYGHPLPNEYELIVNINEDDYSDFTLGIIGYLKDLFEWKHSGSPEVFSYCIQPFRIGLEPTKKKDLELEENDNIIVGIMRYNGKQEALVLAIRKQYLENIKHERENNYE